MFTPHASPERCRGDGKGVFFFLIMKNSCIRLVPAFCAVASFCYSLHAETVNSNEFSTVKVTASRVEMDDTLTPFASEIYTKSDIQNSGVNSLFEFLEKFTSLQVTPSSGNKASPNLDARGFGQQFGYENLVVAVDGRRLNNVDMSNPFLSSVALNNIERIEIALGSGSVLFGDGATAGVLNIVTTQFQGATVDAHTGSNGQNGAAVSAGKAYEGFHIGFSSDQTKVGSFSQKDASGNADSSKQNNWQINGRWTTSNKAKLDLFASHSDQDIWYPGYLTQSQWLANPSQTPSTGTAGFGFSHQNLNTDTWGAKVTLPISTSTSLIGSYNSEAKKSSFLAPYTYGYDYSKQEAELAIDHKVDKLKTIFGLQFRNSDRSSVGDNVTSKETQALFFQNTHFIESYTFMYGARTEEVKLNYTALNGSNTLNDTKRLNSVETGVNKKVNDALSIFTNYSHSNRTPDVDMFFSYDFGAHRQVFNGSIAPMSADTVTLGFNHLTPSQKLKANLFYAKLKNEIFYEPNLGVNTNYSETHKYGIALQERINFNSSIDGWVNYTYTTAVVDKDSSSVSSGSFNGTFVPGVSKNVINGGVRWRFNPATAISLTQTWRDKAYAYNDVANNASQFQKIYRSTDLMLSHSFDSKLQGYVSVKNLLNQANGTWVDVNQIYPYNFSRTWIVGLKVTL